ncbi:hypothetical protein V8C37DRAFT_407939 [Trichoderma ceciliae]
MANSTSSIINNLKFTVSKQLRSMVIILAGLNIAMALVLAIVVFRNCYKGAKRSDPIFGFRSSPLNIIDTTEIFPFALSIGIIAQGIVYVISQTKGLQGLLILGCTSISQAMLPALFLVPFIQLLFGLETTVQALRRRPFPRQSGWVISACLLIVIIGTVAMYLVARLIKPPDFCYASLFWFVQTWRLESFTLLTGISCTLIVGAVVIFVRLHQDTTIGLVERATASRMVCYMILGAILNGLMVPFFFSISSQNPLALTEIQLQLDMVASVASNVSGITFGVLYLFLRSRKMQKIGPLGHIELGGSRKEKTFEPWPGTDVFNKLIEQPVTSAKMSQFRARTTSSASSAEAMENTNGEDDGLGLTHITSNGDAADGSKLLNVPLTPVVPRIRKDSYRLFPSQRETLGIKHKGTTGILPRTTYTPMGSNDNAALGNEMEVSEELPPPPTIHISGAPRHNRDSSLVSSATVQIGLRVSNLSDVTRLEAPFFFFFFFSPERPFSLSRPGWPLYPALAAEPPNTAAYRLNGLALKDDDYNDLARSPIGATVEVRRHEQQTEVQDEESITLSPAVYSPDKVATPPRLAHHKGMASKPSSPAVAVIDDRCLVGTAEWI